MTLSEFEAKRCEKLLAEFIREMRPPPHLRARLDLAFRIHGQSIEIFELRPHLMDKEKILEHPIAKSDLQQAETHLEGVLDASRYEMAWLSAEP